MLLGIRRTRRDVEGASESIEVGESGKSILMPDVTVAPTEEVDDSLYARLAPKSYMLVPLAARGRALGSLTLLSTREGRHYGKADLDVRRDARGPLRAGDRQRAPARRRRAHADAAGLRVRDRAGRARVRRPRPALRARQRRDDERPTASTSATLRGRCSAGACSTAARRSTTCSSAATAGGDRHWNVSCAPVRGPGGDGVGVSARGARRHRAPAAARRRARGARPRGLPGQRGRAARRDARLRARRSRPWPTSRSPRSPTGARRQRARRRRRAAAGRRRPHRPRAAARWARSSSAATRPTRSPEHRLDAGRARRARPSSCARSPRRCSSPAIADPEQLALVRELDLRSIIIAPLRARGADVRDAHARQLASSSRLFEQADVQLAEELAPARRRSRSTTRGSTPSAPGSPTRSRRGCCRRGCPRSPARVLAARYRAAGELNEVGGDFYDVFPRAPDEWAWWSATSRARARRPRPSPRSPATRCAPRALDDGAPAQGAAAAQRRDATTSEGAQFATAALAYLLPATRPDQGPARRWPATRRRSSSARDGRGRAGRRVGDMLGLGADAAFHEIEAPARPGRLLLLYTDGVTEAGPRTRPFGEFGFVELLGTLGRRVAAGGRRRGRARRWSPPTRASRATTSRCSRSGLAA